MKRIIIVVALICSGVIRCHAKGIEDTTSGKKIYADERRVNAMIENIHWLGHASFRIDTGSAVIYIDPWRLEKAPKADIILVTHDHYDHCSPGDIAKITKDDTVILAAKDAAPAISGDVKVVKPGDVQKIGDIMIFAVPAYNVNKFRSPGVLFHPKEKENVGYIIKVDEVKIYHAGDTDHIPEMKGFETDIALLPVSGTYVMTVDEAVEAAASIQPKTAIPMHVGRGIGSIVNREEFKKKAGIPVDLIPKEFD